MEKQCLSVRSETQKQYAAVDQNKNYHLPATEKSPSPPVIKTINNETNHHHHHHQQQATYDRFVSPATKTRLATLVQIGEDWLYLALLGIIMALLSFSMDSVITLFLNTRLWMFKDLSEDNMLIQYLGWCLTPIILVIFSSGFVHICSPTAIGSGIPEMKTILRGVVLNEYLTFRTLIAKVVGLTFTLGSGLPLGKEGPFVHMASIVATLLSKLVASFQGIYENESRTSEMLSAACAVGVAATFYAPIGGVLFSIEVTTVYFAVRNYWRGFFAACCGATIWRLLGFWIKNDESISALFKTNFRNDFPFDPIELLMFSFIGATCGLAGAGYIMFHREIVKFFRGHKRLSEFFQKNRFVYPILVTLIITTVTFPPLIGKYTASTLSTHTTIEHLFSNRTWSLGYQDLASKQILDEWSTPDTSFYLHLILYTVMMFWTSALASTIPIPSGIFIPVLKMGAAYGRLVGELMHLAFPDGFKYGDYIHPASIVPGSYAVVGAAAFSGAVTHTISTSVILFEMTGQIVHIIPVILGVLIANAVCQSLQPSIYDSIIEIKKLPYLPPIASSNSISHKIIVKDFMNTNLAFVWKEKCTYADLKTLLSEHKKIISFPLVDSPHTMKLLGSVPRHDLLKLLYLQLGRERRLQEVSRRGSDTMTMFSIDNCLNISSPNQVADKANELDTSQDQDRGLEFETHKDRASLIGACCDGGTGETKQTRSSDSDSSNGLSSQKSSDANIEVQLTQDSQSTIQDESNNDQGCSHGQLEVGSPSAVAKLINHYDRGSSMDDENLEKGSLAAPGILAGLSIPDKPGSKRVDSAAGGGGGGDGGGATQPVIGGVSIVVESKWGPVEATKGGGWSSLADTNTLTETRLRVPSSNRLIDRPWSPLQELGQDSVPPSPALGSRPKSILKASSASSSSSNMYKRNISTQSFASQLDTKMATIQHLSQAHGHGALQVPLQPLRGAQQLQILTNFVDGGEDGGGGGGSIAQPGPGAGSPLELTPVRQRRKVKLPRLRVVDMTLEEQKQWENEQLTANVDISGCQIDEAPFQLVEQTSLYRVHTLFSMLGLNHAYVTSFGSLVGVVALKDMRFAIEKMLQEK